MRRELDAHVRLYVMFSICVVVVLCYVLLGSRLIRCVLFAAITRRVDPLLLVLLLLMATTMRTTTMHTSTQNRLMMSISLSLSSV